VYFIEHYVNNGRNRKRADSAVINTCALLLVMQELWSMAATQISSMHAAAGWHMELRWTDRHARRTLPFTSTGTARIAACMHEVFLINMLVVDNVWR
jgi:hypothetical protein